MATTTATADPALNKEYQQDTAVQDHAVEHGTNGATNQRYYGGNPLAHTTTTESARLPAFGGEFQPGLYRPNDHRKFANPAPLGLSAFALTTFVLSLINIQARNVSETNIMISLAFGYGGFVQLCAGMWEVAVGNTFGATALSSYGGFWISFAIILTPSFNIAAGYSPKDAATGKLTGHGVNDFNNAMGFFLLGWWIFTTILLICTLRSTVAFFMLFFTLDIAFLLLAIGHLQADAAGKGNLACQKAGGYFGLFAALLAWYNALAGIADSSNSFFVIPVAHFPWSVKGREERTVIKSERDTV
ncbi:Glyoxylate pathway regulator [Venustampulla echinocandica]|uniref:Glyoxylate pathway regulator n=1 Tax=Venustampulla echinocandica TaxID=2656787 RepID=A0A370TB67_9HELO|nr:Glyoxylate pathway regulator [Venustampulla echinocandica]RDL31186.1 Glyoxylate pathway regulator [Venustampulla echinocandica]